MKPLKVFIERPKISHYTHIGMHRHSPCTNNTWMPTLVPSVGGTRRVAQSRREWVKVVSLPKGTVLPPLLKARKVVIVAGMPQLGNVTIAIEAKRRLERLHTSTHHEEALQRLPPGG